MHTEMQQGFSKFTWLLGLFCLPSALFPLAWFVSPHFSQHPELSSAQINFFSITFWVYPLVLLGLSWILFKLHKRQPALAYGLLLAAFVAFYALAGHIFSYF